MVNYKYQVIKLKEVAQGLSGLSFFIPEIKTFVDKQYNNIHSFGFYFEKDNTSVITQNQLSVINRVEIRKFKISNYEIVGERTPLKLFTKGNSIPLNKKFTEINIPNNLQEVEILLANFLDKVSGTIYLVLRLNNVQPEEYFKNYFRYETFVQSIYNNPLQAIAKFNFRPKAGVKNLKGVSLAFNEFNVAGVPYIGIGAISKSNVGKLIIQLNNLKSSPILINIKDYVIDNVKKQVDFVALDEPILPSSDIDCVFINRNVPAGIIDFGFYLTLKYSIK